MMFSRESIGGVFFILGGYLAYSNSVILALASMVGGMIILRAPVKRSAV